VFGGVVATGEAAGTLEDDVDAQILPGERSGILLADDADLIAIDEESAAAGLDGARVLPVDGVVAEQMCERLVVGEVVDRDEVEWRVALLGRAENVAADAAEAVDGDADASRIPSHVSTPIRFESTRGSGMRGRT
jgi:hypothetical protein